MKCPACHNPLITLELHEVEVDHCLSCKGIWLDSEELEVLLEGGEDKDNLLSSFEIAIDSAEKKIKCPICRKKMEKVLADKDSQLIIDRCVKSHGLWFNEGELNNLLIKGQFPPSHKVYELLNDLFPKSNELEEK